MPKISVIVPVYNVESYLHRCVNSILTQSFTDFELILVDDGSPDGCPAICDEYKEKDSRIIVIHKENGGLSSARNAGIDWIFANSNSEWLTFIDSDDWIHPEYLNTLYQKCVAGNYNIAICQYEKNYGKVENVKISSEDFISIKPDELWKKERICATVACCKLYNKLLWEKIRFPEGRIHEDEFTTYKLLFQCESIAYLPKPMYYYFMNQDSIMRSKWTPKHLDVIDAYKEQIDFFYKNEYENLFLGSSVEYFTLMKSAKTRLKNNKEYHKYFIIIKKRMKNEIRRFRSEYGVTVRDNLYIYKQVYPTAYIFFRLYRFLSNRLKK